MPLKYHMAVKAPKAKWLQTDITRRILVQEYGIAVASIMTNVSSLAQEATPVDRGTARAAIADEVVRGYSATVFVRGRVYGRANAPHLPFLEYGTRPHWPPMDPIKKWAKRVLHDESAAYPVAWAISRRGTRAHHMFRNAWREVKPKVRPTLRVAHSIAVRRLKA